jgi:hypothetical protein
MIKLFNNGDFQFGFELALGATYRQAVDAGWPRGRQGALRTIGPIAARYTNPRLDGRVCPLTPGPGSVPTRRKNSAQPAPAAQFGVQDVFAP